MNERIRIRFLDSPSDNRKSKIQNLKWSDCRFWIEEKVKAQRKLSATGHGTSEKLCH